MLPRLALIGQSAARIISHSTHQITDPSNCCRTPLLHPHLLAPLAHTQMWRCVWFLHVSSWAGCAPLPACPRCWWWTCCPSYPPSWRQRCWHWMATCPWGCGGQQQQQAWRLGPTCGAPCTCLTSSMYRAYQQLTGGRVCSIPLAALHRFKVLCPAKQLMSREMCLIRLQT